jgi:hypothetical protein
MLDDHYQFEFNFFYARLEEKNALPQEPMIAFLQPVDQRAPFPRIGDNYARFPLEFLPLTTQSHKSILFSLLLLVAK